MHLLNTSRPTLNHFVRIRDHECHSERSRFPIATKASDLDEE